MNPAGTMMGGFVLLNLWIGAMLPPQGPAVAPPEPRAAAAATAPARAVPWKMVAARGQVETKASAVSAESWIPVRRGDRVAPLSRLRTLDRARATLTRSGDLILVDAGSEIVVPETAPGQGTSVLQSSGNAIYRVAPRRAGDRFEVRTPYLVAGVKGTRFSVQIKDGMAAVNVIEGVVEVRSVLTGEKQDLAAGETAIVGGNDSRMELHRDADRPRHDRETPADMVLDAVMTTSVRLDDSLQKDADLLSATDTGLWSDLCDDTMLTTRSLDRTIEKSTVTLDPVSTRETSNDTTLIDAVPLPRKTP